MAIVLCVVGLSGCGESKTEEMEMPEIVFVLSFHYPGVKDYLTGTFKGTAGYCIDKNGDMKYFEFEYPDDPAYEYEKECITVEEYSEIRKLSEFHENVKANIIDTKFPSINKEELLDYYKLLKKIKSKNELKLAYTYAYHQGGLVRIYGVRKEKDNTEKYILIKESWDVLYNNQDSYSEKLYNSKLTNYYPTLSGFEFFNMDDKLNNEGEVN